jgi:hypothetical protein
VIALARRDGPAATDVYLTAVASTSADVREYGLMVLSAEGDDRAWDPVLATVSEILGRKRISYGRWYDMLTRSSTWPGMLPAAPTGQNN